MRAIDKMVKILEQKYAYGPISYTLDWALKEARRLAAEEATENSGAELLEALEMMCDMADQDRRSDWPQTKHSRAIIAKAKGESK